MSPQDELDAERVFLLVRDMPYARATSREPETIIEEWRGTCSGKHYLLKALFAELGYASRLIAWTTVADLEPERFLGKMRRVLEQSNGRLVDVHNYLILELPDSDMIVDATWPLDAKGSGAVVNEQFILGRNQTIAADPIKSWIVPDDRDPQEFKNEIPDQRYSPQELIHREAFIEAIGELSESMGWDEKPGG